MSQPAQPPRRQHRGDRPPHRARLHPHHRDRLPPRTATGDHYRRRNHGRAVQRNLALAPVPEPPRTHTSQPLPRAALPRRAGPSAPAARPPPASPQYRAGAGRRRPPRPRPPRWETPRRCCPPPPGVHHHPVMLLDHTGNKPVLPLQRRLHRLRRTSRSRVDPSMSVSKNVTISDGSSASPPPRPGGPRSGADRRAREALTQQHGKFVGQQPLELPRRGESPVRHRAGRPDASIIPFSRGSSSGAGHLRYSSIGLPAASRYSSASPEMSIPGATPPCGYHHVVSIAWFDRSETEAWRNRKPADVLAPPTAESPVRRLRWLPFAAERGGARRVIPGRT